MKALRYTMGRSYSKIRSNLHLKNYIIHFKGINGEDLADAANAQSKARANVPEGLCREQWPRICESFENSTLKVNISY